jgi:acetyl esterase/lipase
MTVGASMAFEYDLDLQQVLRGLPRSTRDADHPKQRSVREVREEAEAALAALQAGSPAITDLSTRDAFATSHDGSSVKVRWYTKQEAEPGSAVVYLHGGGMICGDIDLCEWMVTRYVEVTGVPMLAVNYRVAPEHPHPAPVEDCFAGLRWLHAHSTELGVAHDRIAVMGESAGGGLAAAVALLARDRRTPLARQVLVAPMLDDRTTTPDPNLVPFALWSYEDNRIGWSALLGTAIDSDEVSPYAAPARAERLDGVAPAYIEVGALDIFRGESMDYARRLGAAGVSVELHVHPGAPHGFEVAAPESGLARRAMADRARVVRAL